MIALTGHLGAGKTTVLNALLRAPHARLGVVINDFGTINVDAGLVIGQIDEAEAISGGCLCCLPDAGGLDAALEKLTQPRLRLDAVIVEASGIADPSALAQLIRFSGVDRVRPGGLIEVIDAVEHFTTIDIGVLPPARYAAATLIVINKTDRIPSARRAAVIEKITRRVRERNSQAHIIVTTHGRIDPALVFDAARHPAPDGELPFASLIDENHEPHAHADAVTVTAAGPVDPGRLVDLLEHPPDGVYRIKGTVTIGAGVHQHRYAVNVVGHHIHIAAHPAGTGTDCLVAIGMNLREQPVHDRLQNALHPATEHLTGNGLRRLTRYRRLSV
ncbi:CobW family GTP-binding protein [Cryobacterium sp. MP_3.1]|uniref:CobW family GTP-binding protein n=1 Tax=Cryobacterium sp. MP_3.1 TaxID=3071711 RepID=UPI002E14F8D9